MTATSSQGAGARGAAGFRRMWSDLESLGLDADNGGYHRFALDPRGPRPARVVRRRVRAPAGSTSPTDRMGNQWAWWGDPDAAVAAGDPGVVIGSHLDSVPDGGAFDGPLGVVGAPRRRRRRCASGGFTPARPVGVVNFADEEGARFGVACAGSRVITGALGADRARGLADRDGVTMAEAHAPRGSRPRPPRPRRRDAGPGRHLRRAARRAGPRPSSTSGTPSASAATSGRTGAGASTSPARPTTPGPPALDDREDAMLGLAAVHHRGPPRRRDARLRRHRRQGARRARRGQRHRQRRHRLARRPGHRRGCRAAGRGRTSARSSSEFDGLMTQESWTPTTDFDPVLVRRIATHARRPAGHRHGRGPRRRHPRERRHPHRHALRAQPHRRLALARRVGLGRRLPRRRRWPSPPSSPTSPGLVHDVVLVRARGAPRRGHGGPCGSSRTAAGSSTCAPRPPPSRTTSRLRGRRAARPGQRPQPRLPPGAARAHPRRRRQLLDVARRDVCRDAPPRPRDLPRAGQGGLRRDAARRLHGRRRVPLRPPRRRAAGATTTPTSWGRRCSARRARPASGSPCSTPATSPVASPRAATCPSTRCRSASATARSTPGPTRVERPLRRRHGADRHGRALGAGRAARRPRRGGRVRGARRVVRCTCTCPSSPARTSPARASTAAHRPSCSPARGCSGRRRPSCTRRTCPTRTSSCSAARARTACFCPTTERDLADGIGPARRLHDAGSAARARLRPAGRHRPVRGAARRRDARAPREPGARAVRRRRPARHGHPVRLPLARLGRRRARREGPPRRPRRRAARQPAHRRVRPRPGALRGDVGRRHATSSSHGERVVAGGQHRAGDVGRLLADAIAAVRR